MVDGEPGECGLARNRSDTHVVAPAVPAHRLRRMDERPAVPAFLDPQFIVCARSPEELVLVGERRKRTARYL
jgi:hypothetical protein